MGEDNNIECSEIKTSPEGWLLGFDNGYLIFEKREDITIGLIISKPSNYVREALINFDNDFTADYSEELAHFSSNQSVFSEADTLIKRNFSF